jgi:small-conductance mechanosensitive channel
MSIENKVIELTSAVLEMQEKLIIVQEATKSLLQEVISRKRAREQEETAIEAPPLTPKMSIGKKLFLRERNKGNSRYNERLECADCKAFLNAMQDQGIVNTESRKDYAKKCNTHLKRDDLKRNNMTPPGFWEFPDLW